MTTEYIKLNEIRRPKEMQMNSRARLYLGRLVKITKGKVN